MSSATTAAMATSDGSGQAGTLHQPSRTLKARARLAAAWLLGWSSVLRWPRAGRGRAWVALRTVTVAADGQGAVTSIAALHRPLASAPTTRTAVRTITDRVAPTLVSASMTRRSPASWRREATSATRRSKRDKGEWGRLVVPATIPARPPRPAATVAVASVEQRRRPEAQPAAQPSRRLAGADSPDRCYGMQPASDRVFTDG